LDVVSTLAGGSEGFADGAGSAAAFNTPSALAIDPRSVDKLYKYFSFMRRPRLVH
jgi:hypothetical protein